MSRDNQTLITNLAVISLVSGVFIILTGLWGWIFKIDAIHYMFSRVASLNITKKNKHG
jgi:hypothetical protein